VTRHTRRRFLQSGAAVAGLGVLAGGGLLAWQAFAPSAVKRIGFLGQTIPLPMYVGLNQGLRELGYIEGENLSIEYRYAEGKFERLPELARELISLKLDLLVVSGTLGAHAAKSVTSTIPIVVALSTDLVGAGVVETLARPGGNITGLSQLSTVLVVKRLELLRETLPGLRRLAVLMNAANATNQLQWAEAERFARDRGLQLQQFAVRGGDDLPGAFDAAARDGAEAMFILDDALFPAHRPFIIGTTLQQRLPLAYSGAEEARLGALIGYGPNIPEQFRRAATYVDKILKGAKPGDLPIEQPTTFDLVINLKTAHALGLTIPPSVLQQATELIQ